MTDHLSRKPFIDMLKTIVQSQRGNPAGYSFAIDGEWGCGKTWVLDALEEQLSADGGSPYLIFRYNAWENDFYDEPIAAILSVMIGRLEDISKTDAAINEINAKLFATAAMLLKNIAVSIANTTLKNKAGLDFEDVAGDLKSVKDATVKQKKLKKEIDGLFPLRKGIDEIRAEIKKLSDTFSVILIVDELDRCLPEYAIKVLERLHHVCNALPVIQIAAYSGRALANAVSQVYGGQSPDEVSQKAFAAHYLEKFFRLQIPLHYGISNDLTCMYEGLEANYEPMFDASEDFLKQFFNAALEKLPIRSRKHVFEAVKMAHDIALAADDGKDFVCTYELLCCEILVSIDRVLLHAQSPFRVGYKEKENLLRLVFTGNESERYGETLSFDDFSELVGQISILFQKQRAPIPNLEWYAVPAGNSIAVVFLTFADGKSIQAQSDYSYRLGRPSSEIIAQNKMFMEKFCAFLYQVSI